MWVRLASKEMDLWRAHNQWTLVLALPVWVHLQSICLHKIEAQVNLSGTQLGFQWVHFQDLASFFEQKWKLLLESLTSALCHVIGQTRQIYQNRFLEAAYHWQLSHLDAGIQHRGFALSQTVRSEAMSFQTHLAQELQGTRLALQIRMTFGELIYNNLLISFFQKDPQHVIRQYLRC